MGTIMVNQQNATGILIAAFGQSAKLPYVSAAQRGYFHAHKKELEKQGVDVSEWDRASKGKKLPKKKVLREADYVRRHKDKLNGIED
jgi:hypothetical protein